MFFQEIVLQLVDTSGDMSKKELKEPSILYIVEEANTLTQMHGWPRWLWRRI